MAVENDILPPRYRDPTRVGRGGMGDIFRATDDVLGREVAIKLLSERFAEDTGVRERFTREALTAARVSAEPSIVTIFDVGQWEGRPFIVMEYLPGGSLDEVLARDGPQAPGQALAWLEQAARALDAAHANGVVHRDVKPANLLLDREAQVHVADFGIATAAGLDSMTRPGTILGTAGYLAPEQAQGERATPATDRYALAVVAFELLSGERPFASDTPTAEAAAHVHAPVPSISARRPDLPPELDHVFRRALAKDPEARYASCAELVGALRGAFERAAGTTRALAPVPPPATHVLPAGRRALPVLPLVLAGLLILAAGGIALAALLGGDERQPAAPATEVRTVVTTAQGTTEVVTTTAPAQATQEEPPAEAEPTGAELNDEAFALMQEGRYEEALPLLEQAVSKLAGEGSRTEAFALYNLAFTRLQLGRCDGVPELLDRSEELQGERREIGEARRQYREQCE